MQDPAPRRIPQVPSAVNLNRRNIFAVRHWPPGCGPPSQRSQPQSAGTATQPALQTITVTKESEISEVKIENLNKSELGGRIENVGGNVGSSSKRWFESKTYPPPKRREISAIREFPPCCSRNLALNLDLNPNQTEIEPNNQKIQHQEEKPSNVCTDIVVWEPKTGKPNPDSSLSETGNWIPEIRSTNSSYTDLVSLAPLKQNKKNHEEEAKLCDFAIRTITDSRLYLRKTARKSVRGPPKLVISEKKSPKTENSNPNPNPNSNSNSNSNSLIIYKSGITNFLNLNPYQNNSTEQPSIQRTRIKQLLQNFHSVYRKKVQEEESTPRENKKVDFRSGPACNCPSSCPNRVSQKGIIYKLEVFRKELNEWGVRSLGSISCGSFVCEYVGEVREKDDVIMIDCGERGNVARFLMRSKSPNLMVQKVLFDHGDVRLAHVMFFAVENIPPLQELTY